MFKPEVADTRASAPLALAATEVKDGNALTKVSTKFISKIDQLDKTDLVIAFFNKDTIEKDLQSSPSLSALFPSTTDAELVSKLLAVNKGLDRPLVVPSADSSVLLVPFSGSPASPISLDGFRLAVHTAVRAAKSLKAASVAVVLPDAGTVAAEDAVQIGYGSGVNKVKSSTSGSSIIATLDTLVSAATGAAITGDHTFDRYWSKSRQEGSPAVTSVQLVLADSNQDKSAALSAASAVVSRAAVLAESVVFARELSNGRADDVTPAFMEQVSRTLATQHPDVLKVSVLQMDELVAKGYHLIAAVGQAAVVPPRLVVLEYNGTDSTDSTSTPLALVGKGITFDSGGLNIKTAGMEDMHMDMSGSAAVIAAVRYAAIARPKSRFVGVLALAENAIDSKAYKPHSIIASAAGSVQIGNTDAEGRLVLADALTYVQNTYKPARVVDLATLTGACVIALGEYAAGVFSNDPMFAAQLQVLGQKHYERLWPMPIFPENQQEMKGTQADVNSTGLGRYGGASNAAAFLEKYVKTGVSWAHIDLAGPASYSRDRGYLPKGGTGFGVHTLAELIDSQN